MSELLGVTRNPVRQALRELENEGLVARFDGRGMLAGGASETPLRQPLTPAMLGLGDESEPVRKAQGWEHIYHAVEHDVVHLSVFGAYRLNEVELARHFGVGRTAARDVLLRLEGLGLVGRTSASAGSSRRWTSGASATFISCAGCWSPPRWPARPPTCPPKTSPRWRNGCGAPRRAIRA